MIHFTTVNHDDDAAIITTVLKETSIQQQEQQCSSTTTSKHTKNRVSFLESNNKYYENPTRAFEDCHSTWYSHREFKQFKKSVRRCARAAVNNTEHEVFFKQLFALFTFSRKVGCIHGNVNDAMTPALEQQLKSLFQQNDESLIGLESRVVLAIRQDVRKRREEKYKAIQDIQTEYHQGQWSDAEVNEVYRGSCLVSSQASGLFAQLLAMAKEEQQD